MKYATYKTLLSISVFHTVQTRVSRMFNTYIYFTEIHRKKHLAFQRIGLFVNYSYAKSVLLLVRLYNSIFSPEYIPSFIFWLLSQHLYIVAARMGGKKIWPECYWTSRVEFGFHLHHQQSTHNNSLAWCHFTSAWDLEFSRKLSW